MMKKVSSENKIATSGVKNRNIKELKEFKKANQKLVK